MTAPAATTAPREIAPWEMIAVVPVRDGVPALGGAEAMAEAGGQVLLIGDGLEEAAAALPSSSPTIPGIVRDAFEPGEWAAALATLVHGRTVIVPGSPDGRDLAPRLALSLGCPHIGGAVEVTPTTAVVARRGGRIMRTIDSATPFVATLQPGVRGAPAADGETPTFIRVLATPAADSHGPDAVTLGLVPADPATMDLGEAPSIVGAGAGLGSPDAVAALGRLAERLGASLGATRVVTDLDWAPFERQIGTTGVTVDPDLYLAFGISGAVQHTSGLGSPEHIVSVNLDASCPMMSMADVAIVSDAPAVIDALLAKLS